MMKSTNESAAGSHTPVGKLPPNGNPLVAHKFGADPYALVFAGSVYLYMTSDALEFDEEGCAKENSYKSINKITVISSADLVNWTDHGEIQVAGPEGAATWATQSWAPAAAHKVINGQDKFFLYFANNASGIGVLSADSPVGPWTDPIGEALITRATPGVEAVTWLFDPAVLADDDGKAYIYFGGGVPEEQYEWPDTARVMELGSDMISVLGEAVTIPAPYMFEDAGINKFKGTYYYSYCSNFYKGARPAGSPPAGEIAYMTSDSPMGPWKYKGSILKNPEHFFGTPGNNHHAIFQFHDAWYIAYHAQTLSRVMDIPDGYRSTHINRIYFDESNGSILETAADLKGVEPVSLFDPYVRVSAATMGWSAGVKTEPVAMYDNTALAHEGMAVTGIDQGDWIALTNVDFGSRGASAFTASVAGGELDGTIELRLDQPDGKRIGKLAIPAASQPDQWNEMKTEISGAEGIHSLYFVFAGAAGKSLFKLKSWKFSE